MKTNLGNPTGGMLAISGKEFSCKIGDSLETIKKQNTNLTNEEVLQVFNITREQIDEVAIEAIEENENDRENY